MSIPTHRISCHTKAFQTKCPDCQDAVWFFSCSCGSRTYFDDLGWPWPQHYCKKYAVKQAIEMIRNIERYTDKEIYSIIEDYRKKHSQEISEDIWDMLEYELGKRRFPFRYIDVACNSDIKLLTGQVMEINRSINLYKKFKLDPYSPFTNGLLGNLANRSFHEVQIRESPNKKNISNQYYALIDLSFFKRNSFKKGDKIIAEVNFVQIPSAPIWEITSISVH